MERGQRDRDLLKAARAQGLLDPLFDYLVRRVNKLTEPEEPSGSEWPYKRAYRDGMIKEAAKVLEWLDGRSKLSPDEAKNTED